MGKKIIVIDDSASTRQSVSNTLIEAGYEVVEAVDGKDGLNKIHQHTDANLVICDVQMPRMTGPEMIEAVRKGPVHKDVAIVMLTTEVQPELLARAKAAGAKGWIVKPFKRESFLATVRKLVGPAQGK